MSLAFNKRTVFLLVLSFFGILFVSVGAYLWRELSFRETVGYQETYRLVPEKISQSASIRISLPPGTAADAARPNIVFDPPIQGKWNTKESKAASFLEKYVLSFASAKNDENANMLFFQPSERLELNRYYKVQLALQGEEGTISADFLAVEDPEVVAVFPASGVEAQEDSEITIVFNRPMVPLTTLEELEGKDVPVEITPATEGRFKWITTRNLQFIPKDRLARSSHYKVAIKQGFISMDGLEVKGKDYEFTTRHLRYMGGTQSQVVYNEPITLYFNQPVDINRTAKEIVLKDSNGKEIPFVAAYKKKDKSSGGEQVGAGRGELSLGSVLGLNNWFDKSEVDPKTDDETNQSIIQIYNRKDEFGREKFWDFEKQYSIELKKAYPLEGDIALEQSNVFSVRSAGIIKNISAVSERTHYATDSFFDPQGKAKIEFYEEINLGKTKITSQRLVSAQYGEKCEDEQYSYDRNCKKAEDKKQLILAFDHGKIGLGEELTLKFEKIVNDKGIQINKKAIERALRTYPAFGIIRSNPAPGAKGASLTDITFCSTTPIAAPAQEEMKNYFSADKAHELMSWGNSYKVDYPRPGQGCSFGEFATVIRYGLMPNEDYFLKFQLQDVFGQKLSQALGVTTGAVPSEQVDIFHLQQDYNVTIPSKTKLAYAAKNVEYVNVNICKISSSQMLSFFENRIGYFDSTQSRVSCQQSVNHTVQLPKRYWINNYFTLDIADYMGRDPGHYIVTLSHPNYTRRSWNEKGTYVFFPAYERTYLTVTNLGVAEKKISPEGRGYGDSVPLDDKQLNKLFNLYWITNLSDLSAVQGATVNFYKGNSFAFAGSATTDANGIALSKPVQDLRGAVVVKGADSAIIPRYSSTLDWASPALSAERIYLYTDKPLYQPTQEVFIKGIHRIGYDGSYEVFKDKKFTLTVYNSRDDSVSSQSVQPNDFGTFEAKFILEKDAPLGTYRVCAKSYHCTYFDILEYVPAPFEATLKTGKEEYVSKDTVEMEVNANYYFGVPLESGEVSYTISSQNYYFDRFKGDYFNFGLGWYYYDYYSSDYSFSYGDKFLMRGKASIGKDGKARISETLDFEKLFPKEEDRKSKLIIVDVTVQDNQGRSISSQKSFIMHAGQVYLGLKTDKSYLGKNEEVELKIKSVDTEGKELRVTDGLFSVYRVEWTYSKRQEATGAYSYKWEKKRELVQGDEFATDERGNYSKRLRLDKEGEYEIEAKIKDKLGNTISTSYNLYVYGTGLASVHPTNDTTLEVEAVNRQLKVGDEGEVIIKSPYDRSKALVTLERGEVFKYEIIDLVGNFHNYRFKVNESHVPNLFASVLVQSSEPSVKFGQVEFFINTDVKTLDIEVQPSKTQYLPGEEVIFNIIAKDMEGRPVEAELSVGVVDVSVLALKGNPKKNPTLFFYNGFPLAVTTSSNLKNILVETKILTKGGGGGADAGELARKARGDFKETAFWEGQVRTNGQGQAQLRFNLPDNLTTWQAEVLGVTKDTKLGVAYKDFTVKKDLMVVPLKPRFIVPGDEFSIGAKIFNQSQNEQELEVRIESQSLGIVGEAKRGVDLNPGETKTVYFIAKAPNELSSGEHKFVLSAKNKNLEDTVIQYIPITPNSTYETTATASYATGNITREYIFLPGNVLKDRGELSIQSSATLAVFMSGALDYMLQYPYGCAEQISSKLNSIAVVQQGLNLPNMQDKFQLKKISYQGKEFTVQEVAEIGLAQLSNTQNSDGGFPFWRGGDSDFYVTLHVLEALQNLSKAGFNVNQSMRTKAASYVYSQTNSNGYVYENKDSLVLAAYVLSHEKNFEQGKSLQSRVLAFARDEKYIQEQISTSSLLYLALTIAEGKYDAGLENKLSSIIDSRLMIDARGAFLEPNRNRLWYYFETPVKDTALYLELLSLQKRDNAILDKAVSWLLNSKDKDGAWGTTANTMEVIKAFTRFIEWKRETESNYELQIFSNGIQKGEFAFNADTIIQRYKTIIPIKDLAFSKNNIVELSKENKNAFPNTLYYDMALRYYLPADQIGPRDEGFSITRGFYTLEDEKGKNALKEARVGQVLRAHIQVTVPTSKNHMIIEDFIPAGMEIVNLDLATEQKSLRLQKTEISGRELYPDFEEIHNDRAFLYKRQVYPGVYEFDYFVRVLVPGKFIHLPAMVSEMYYPENFGRTQGSTFEVK